jgi:membrane associated rhomboid family serine protease
MAFTQVPGSLVLTHFLYYRNALKFTQGHLLPLSPRLRWRLDRIREQMSGLFGGSKEPPRPQLCPACGTLVGANATRCHQCGASMTFSMAAASKSLERLIPMSSPVTYGVLTLSCLFYAVSLVATMRESGLQVPAGGGLSMLFGFGGINRDVLVRLGSSAPLMINLIQPWRFVMAIFLHGTLMHIAFNMFVLMDIGPQVEEMYGSARFLFIYVATGIGGFFLSSLARHISVGGSASLLGLIGILLAVTTGRRNAAMQMMRSNLIRWLIYIAIMGFVFSSTDNLAHLGGLATGYVLGRVMVDRPPVSPEEQKRAQMLGWATALVVIASIAMVARGLFLAG